MMLYIIIYIVYGYFDCTMIFFKKFISLTMLMQKFSKSFVENFFDWKYQISNIDIEYI